MAAGLTVAGAAIPAAMARLSELLAPALAGRAEAGRLRISGLLDPAGATVERSDWNTAAKPRMPTATAVASA